MSAGLDFYLFPRLRSFLSLPVLEKLNVAMKSLNYASAGSADTGSWGMAEIFTIQFDEIAWSLEENMWVLFS